MVEIAPFRALRLKSEKKGEDISSFICPPYDVISPHQREALERKFPRNVVQIELPKGDETIKFANAGRTLCGWKSDAIVQEDRKASFYLLETTFRIRDAFAPDKQLKRYGVLSALRLETPGKGAVRPHEKTLPKAKEERLNLITALKTDVSPIFGLFFDKKKQWREWVSKVTREKPVVKGQEGKDLSHRVWKVEEGPLHKELRAMLKSKDLYIADGHHRYEVAWAYKQQRLKADEGLSSETVEPSNTKGWNYVMAYICPMEEPGLLMLPTHRLLKTNLTVESWRSHLSSVFNIKPVANMGMIIKELIAGGDRKIGWIYGGGMAILTPKADVSLERVLAGRPEALRELDVVLLHDAALGETIKPDMTKDREIIFTRDLNGMEAMVDKDASWVGFVLASPGVASLARVAGANEVMPPKTTYFYPKVPTGFTMMGKEQFIR